jgi:type III pantothenate kinase
VVPAVTGPLTTLCRQWLHIEPLIVSSSLDLGIQLGQREPHAVGVDRIANAVAAWDRAGDACIVIDLGTATKLEAIDASGVFRGGVIAPGLAVSRDALAQRAARLFAVELTAPESVIGRDTMSAVQSGLVLGHARMLEGLTGDLTAELVTQTPQIFLTGGHAFAIQSLLRMDTRTVPNLTLDGLRIIHQRNTRP